MCMFDYLYAKTNITCIHACFRVKSSLINLNHFLSKVTESLCLKSFTETGDVSVNVR